MSEFRTGSALGHAVKMASLLCFFAAALWVPCGNFLYADEKKDDRPNIILVNLDDADWDLLEPELLSELYPTMDRLSRLGVRFTNMHVTTPLCGPSRACLMRGQYAFNTGIKTNIPGAPTSNGFPGGHQEFVGHGYDQDELGVLMKNAGYRTMHIGKYHHHGFDKRLPPGWDDFYMSGGGQYYGTYRFTNRRDPKGRQYYTGKDEYIADVEGRDLCRLLEEHAARLEEADDERTPFFMYLAPKAPHRPNSDDVTDMVDRNLDKEFASDKSIPQTPDFDEVDISDKPAHLQVPRIHRGHARNLSREYSSRLKSMKSVDDMMQLLLYSLKKNGFDENTYILFTSDNGYSLGHHRLQAKQSSYDRSSRVPLFVVGPNVPRVNRANHLLAHIDLTPTILELASVKVPEYMDGKSFLPLLHDPEEYDERSWQTAVMLEGWSDLRPGGRRVSCVYTAIRMYDSVFVNWAMGDFEYYDLSADPYQLTNIYDELPAAVQNQYKHMLRSFRQREGFAHTTVASVPLRNSSEELRLAGYTEDNWGAERVELVIRDPATGRYWDQSDWVEEKVTLKNIALAARGMPVSYWRFSQPKTSELMKAKQIEVVAIGRDKSGNETIESSAVVFDLNPEAKVAERQESTGSTKSKRE